MYKQISRIPTLALQSGEPPAPVEQPEIIMVSPNTPAPTAAPAPLQTTAPAKVQPEPGSFVPLDIPQGARLVLHYPSAGESMTDKALAWIQQYHGVVMLLLFILFSYKRV